MFSDFTFRTSLGTSILLLYICCRYGGEPRHPGVNGGLFFYSGRSMTNMVTLDCPINATDVTDCAGWDSLPRRTSVAGVTCRRTPIPGRLIGHLAPGIMLSMG